MPRTWLTQLVARAVPFGVFGDVRRMENRPDSLQRTRLVYLLQQAATTEWGNRFAYGDLLKSHDPIRAYQERVPLQQYRDLEPLIERVRNGEPDVLWPGCFKYFGISGGTYSTGKVVPASEEVLEQSFRSGVAMTIRYLAHTGNLDAVTGAIIPLTGRLIPNNDSAALLGNFSGLMTHRHLAQLAAKRRQPPPWFPDSVETLFDTDWEQKLNRLADVTMTSDVRYIALIPTWGLIFFRKLIERFNARFGASATCVQDIWPKLKVIVSGGVALKPYRASIESAVGSGVDILETYGAMEAGVIAFQSSLTDNTMLLNTGGSFFEFIRADDRDQPSPQRFWVGSIEPRVRYVPVISNANGLWSYVLGDIVEFTETLPPKLRILGRTSEMLNQFREGLSGDVARQGLEAVSRECGTQFVAFHATYSSLVASGVTNHEWYVEFRQTPSSERRWAEVLDRELRASCATYDRVRRNSGLAMPRLLVVPPGGLHRALARTGRVLDAQAKVPAMTNGREIAEAIAVELSTHSAVIA